MKQYALVIFACISVSVFAADKPGISLIGTRGNARIPGQSGYAETVFDCMATGAAVIGVNSSNSVITELSTVDGFQLISPKMTNLWEAEFSPDCGMISNVPGRVFMRFAVRNAVRQGYDNSALNIGFVKGKVSLVCANKIAVQTLLLNALPTTNKEPEGPFSVVMASQKEAANCTQIQCARNGLEIVKLTGPYEKLIEIELLDNGKPVESESIYKPWTKRSGVDFSWRESGCYSRIFQTPRPGESVSEDQLPWFFGFVDRPDGRYSLRLTYCVEIKETPVEFMFGRASPAREDKENKSGTFVSPGIVEYINIPALPGGLDAGKIPAKGWKGPYVSDCSVKYVISDPMIVSFRFKDCGTNSTFIAPSRFGFLPVVTRTDFCNEKLDYVSELKFVPKKPKWYYTARIQSGAKRVWPRDKPRLVPPEAAAELAAVTADEEVRDISMKLASEGNGFTMWEPPFRGSSWLAYKINPKAPEKDFAVRLMGPVELVSYLRLQDGRKLHAPSAVASAGPGAVDYFFHKSEIPRVTLNLKYRRNPKDIVVFLGK